MKVPSDVRDEFYEAAKTLRVPRRELASALFMHGMEHLRRQVKPAKRTANASPATEASEQALTVMTVNYGQPRSDDDPPPLGAPTTSRSPDDPPALVRLRRAVRVERAGLTNRSGCGARADTHYYEIAA